MQRSFRLSLEKKAHCSCGKELYPEKGGASFKSHCLQDAAVESPKPEAGGFKPCSNYISPQATVAAQGLGAWHGF